DSLERLSAVENRQASPSTRSVDPPVCRSSAPTEQSPPTRLEYLDMDSQTSRKIIVASVMAAVVVIGVVTFALRSHPVVSVAQTPHPVSSVTETPAATLRAAEIPP